MSAYGHQMEREFSSQSLLSREDTESGSQYVLESGFYMKSFAATIFIAGLLIVGVLLVTLIVTLAVMLQSYESRSKGVVEIEKASDSYHYCKAFALHGELNSLEEPEIPPVCWNLAIHYIEGGEYERDLNFTISMIESFFDTISPSDNHLDAVLMDIDDILASNHTYSHQSMHQQQFNQYGSNKPSGSIEDAANLKHWRILELYVKLKSRGWSLILLSRKPERQRNVTAEQLEAVGFNGWSSLIKRFFGYKRGCCLEIWKKGYRRADSEMEMETWEYFRTRRTAMKEEGTQIISVISSQLDALTGSSLGKRVFKLPKPLHYNSQTPTL
ncbi:hypothetical protein ES288_D04G079300v1 [Gossypium darwinii]|uniref:Acid phosphatase n=1 Tax=Gossypium darwinii TaxID=34276 RepID=A0A5D2CWQ8_GOSDA|nr:hypothetical protein ES288_D04G079300v1 [Gossypium darwinii]